MKANRFLRFSELVDDPYYDFWSGYDSSKFLNGDKELFEEFKFIFEDTYYTYEIGYETARFFKHEVHAHMRRRMAYWTKLYETELRSKDIDFMLNKDYTETFTKNVSRTDNQNTTNSNENTSNGSNTMTSQNDNKGSDINDGVSEASLSQGFLTSVGQDKTTSSGSDTMTSRGSSKGTMNGNGTEDENYTLVGKGNIGITSSAELLEKWRSVLISIIEIMIEELRIHFSYVY